MERLRVWCFSTRALSVRWNSSMVWYFKFAYLKSKLVNLLVDYLGE